MITIQLSLNEYQTLRRSVNRAGVIIDLLWLSVNEHPSIELQSATLEYVHDDYQTARGILAKIEDAKKSIVI